jgi:tuberculosinol/isotuberculosinol synthase
MDVQTFRELPVSEVAQLVRSAGPRVCVFPINGTRRWFMLEYPASGDGGPDYREVAARRHIELYQLFFAHGIETLLTPIYGPDLLERGMAYAEMATEGLAWLATHPVFLEFYKAYGVRVRFYGNYRRFLASRHYTYLSDLFDQAVEQTADHDRYRLFFGVCAQDATEMIARLAVEYYTEHGHAPDKATLVEQYYGEPVGPVDLFIGFDKFCAFDMPLVSTGNEDLYFTVSPSPYLSGQQLRDILYDHLYSRRGEEPDYGAMAPDERRVMKEFYRVNAGKTLGVGARRGQIWYPLPQVDLPQSFT